MCRDIDQSVDAVFEDNDSWCLQVSTISWLEELDSTILMTLVLKVMVHSSQNMRMKHASMNQCLLQILPLSVLTRYVSGP